MDIFKVLRLIWLLSPILSPSSLKQRLFNLQNPQVQTLIKSEITDPVQLATCYFLQDDFERCVDYCRQCRTVYVKQKQVINLKDNQFNSTQMVKIYVLELACLIDQLRLPHFTELQKQQIRKRGH